MRRTRSGGFGKGFLADESHAVQQIVSYTDAAWKAARAGLHKTIKYADALSPS